METPILYSNFEWKFINQTVTVTKMCKHIHTYIHTYIIFTLNNYSVFLQII